MNKLIQSLPDEIVSQIMLFTLNCPHKNIIERFQEYSWFVFYFEFKSRTSMIFRVKNVQKWTPNMTNAQGWDQKINTEKCDLVQTLYAINNSSRFMWKKDLKELAKINQIKGRSKLKTRQDYVRAFMKL